MTPAYLFFAMLALVIYSLLSFFYPIAGISILAALIPFQNEFSSSVGTIVKFFGLIVLVMFIIKYSLNRKKIRIMLIPLKTYLIFICFAGLSWIWAFDILEGILILITLISFYIFIVIMINICDSKPKLVTLMRIYISSCCIFFFYGLIRGFNLLSRGQMQLKANPNSLSTALMIGVFFSVYLLLFVREGIINKILGILGPILIIPSIIALGSRSILLATMVFFGVMLFHVNNKKYIKKFPIILLLIFAGTMFSIKWGLMDDPNISRYSSILDWQSFKETERFSFFSATLEDVHQNPFSMLFGNGIGYRVLDMRSPHNDFLLILGSFGYIGLFLYTLFLFTLIRYISRIKNQKIFCYSILSAILVDGLFHVRMYSKAFMLIVAVILIIGMLSKSS